MSCDHVDTAAPDAFLDVKGNLSRAAFSEIWVCQREVGDADVRCANIRAPLVPFSYNNL